MTRPSIFEQANMSTEPLELTVRPALASVETATSAFAPDVPGFDNRPTIARCELPADNGSSEQGDGGW
jgi:hypothetical protein